MNSSGCALCGGHPRVDERLVPRRLVPPSLIERSALAEDPLGTAGATVAICEACVQVLSAPMLLAEDVARFANVLALHRELHGRARGVEDEGTRARLLHRAIHLGLKAVADELVLKPPVAASRPEPDQLGLFSSKAARLADVHTALERGDFIRAMALSAELAEKHAIAEAAFLASRLPAIERKLSKADGDPEALAGIVAKAGALLDPVRVGAALMRSFEKGLARRSG